MKQREAVFEVPLDIPRTTVHRLSLKYFLESMAPQIGVFGRNGKAVGLGFEWRTQTALGGTLGFTCTMARRMLRTFITNGLIDRNADTFNLKQRIRYVRSGEPGVTFRIVEE
jgi:DNA-binding MarR family transcriptional regulator